MLGDLLLRSADRWSDRRVLAMPERSWTYGELRDRTREIARGLMGMGIEPGDRVGLLMPNGVDSLAALFGVSLAGATAVPINTRYRSSELSFLVENAELAAIMTNDAIDDYLDFWELLRDALPGLGSSPDARRLKIAQAPSLRSVIVLGDKSPASAIDAGDLRLYAESVTEDELDDRRRLVRLRDPALILYTSGTTANPRGCLLSHEALVRDWLAVARRLEAGPSDRSWNPCPFFHITGIGVNLYSIATGGSVLTDSYFQPDRALDLIESEQATLLYPAYPPITQAVLQLPRFGNADLRSARMMLNVAPPDVMRQMQAALPHAVQISVFGMTETCGVTSLHELGDDAEVRATTCGRPLPGVEVMITDPSTGAPVALGDRGEIRVRGMNLFSGYYRDEAKTAEALPPSGWLRTGDLGTMDEAGNVTFSGRLKEMLKVGGENVAPAEVESVLSTHPGVVLVQVVGIPDDRLDEVPAAFIELRPGWEATEEEMIAHCRGRIARFKVPRVVRFVSEWPTSATKIQRFRLREQLVREMAGGPEPPVT